ncbi:MAG: hypothetical protein AAF985_17620 [Bacteroidota bacterium]
MESEKTYRPIACGVYDELTLLAQRKNNCRIRYLDEKGEAQQVESMIADIFTKDKAEYLRLATNDLCIRLDHILAIEKVG